MSASILVVDDEPGIREIVATLLMEARFDVRAAADGRAALALHQDKPADLIVSDVMMPRLDGYGLVAVLRQRGDRTPVILLSAAGRPAGGNRVYALGKPFDLDVLMALVARALAVA